jgi:hypothetical protein
MAYVDEHLGELIDQYAAEDGCPADEWMNRAIRATVRQRYELRQALNVVVSAQAIPGGADGREQCPPGHRPMTDPTCPHPWLCPHCPEVHCTPGEFPCTCCKAREATTGKEESDG